MVTSGPAATPCKSSITKDCCFLPLAGRQRGYVFRLSNTRIRSGKTCRQLLSSFRARRQAKRGTQMKNELKAGKLVSSLVITAMLQIGELTSLARSGQPPTRVVGPVK